MNATDARAKTDLALDKAKTGQVPSVLGRIKDRAIKGKKFLLCRSNKQVSTHLQADGFGCILVFNILIVWW